MPVMDIKDLHFDVFNHSTLLDSAFETYKCFLSAFTVLR